MAGRKNSVKNTGRSSSRTTKAAGKARVSKKPLGLLFWALFFILTTGLFLANRDRIQKTLENARVLDHLPVSLPRIGGREKAEETEQTPEGPVQPAPAAPGTAARPGAGQPAGGSPAAGQPAATRIEPRTEPQIRQPEASQPTVSRQPETPRTNSRPPAPPEPAGQNPPGTKPQPSPPAPPSKPSGAIRTTAPVNPPAAATQERVVYFARIDAEGTILRTRVVRRLPASDSPMMDSLRSLIAGPNAEEQGQGLRSLIPPETRLLPTTTVRGNTAYISFSEDFQYNTFGVEGYAAQLRQVIWTATEFPNIKDVQILIEGRRIDYLGEGIWIGSPLSRESL